MWQRIVFAALIAAFVVSSVEAAGGRRRRNRVKVNVKTSQVAGKGTSGDNGQARWEFWDARSSKNNVTAQPVPR
ncbi:MAG TPA: hypothetical protein VG125_13620 [Pirellulales bacterium]|jgi:hypothetical protein|nr:hypothetical protein [Pirellulales bacterium]